MDWHTFVLVLKTLAISIEYWSKPVLVSCFIKQKKSFKRKQCMNTFLFLPWYLLFAGQLLHNILLKLESIFYFKFYSIQTNSSNLACNKNWWCSVAMVHLYPLYRNISSATGQCNEIVILLVAFLLCYPKGIY